MAPMVRILILMLAVATPLAFAQTDDPGLAVPWGSVSAGDVQVTDIAGEAMTRSDVNQIVMFSSEVVNAQGADQPYAYIIHVNDSDGVANALMWSSGTIMAGETMTLPAVWIPQQAGEYEATAMLWESLDDAIALAPKSVTRITVTEPGGAQVAEPTPRPLGATVSIVEGSGVPGCEADGGCFVPASIEVDPGTLVTWENNDIVSHTVVSGDIASGPSGEFNSLLVYPGETYRRVLDGVGEHPYYCQIHPWMSGSVVVRGGSSPPAPVAPVTPTPPATPPAPAPVTPPAPTPTPPTPAPPASGATVIIPEGTGIAGCDRNDECYLPHTIEVDAGTTVTWDNVDAVVHTVTAGSLAEGPTGEFDSSIVLGGSTFEHTFEESGEYPYYCIVHPWMSGSVVVRGGSSPPATPPAPAPVTPPAPTPTPPVPAPVMPPAPVAPVTPTPPAPAPAPEPAPPTPEPPASSATVIIPEGTGVPGCEASNECYLPATIEVRSGTTVTWDNADAVAHTVTAGSLATGAGGEFDSSLLLAGGTFEHTFEETGEYPYYCIVHPWMDGTVIVR